MNLEEMYEQYFSKIYNYVFFRVMNKQDAEDITSIVFLKVAEAFSSFDPSKGDFSSWIFRIAENSLIDFYRKKRFSVNIEDLDDSLTLSTDFEGEANLIKNERLKIMYNELAFLDGKTRHIIAQKYFLDKTIRQIAKDMNMNESTVSTMHNRGLQKLRKQMAEL